MSLPVNISTIADELVIRGGPFEQVSGIRSWALHANYLSATRTIDQEFQWSNDGVTYSGYLPITAANLLAISPNKDLPFYIDTRITRTGTDTNGVVQIAGLHYDYLYDASAVSGHGIIDQPHVDIPNLMIEVVKQHVQQLNGGDAFDVLYAMPADCKPDKRDIIYLNQFSVVPVAYRRTCVSTHTVSFRIGVSRRNQRHLSSVQRMRQQIQDIMFLFSPTTGEHHTWNITYKGLPLLGKKWSDFGLHNFQISAQGDFTDAECEKIDTEFQVRAELEFQETTNFVFA